MKREDVINFIEKNPNGVTETEIFEEFKEMSVVDFSILQNNFLFVAKVCIIVNEEGITIFKPKLQNQHEDLVLELLKTNGNKGIWLKEIKSKTKIPQTTLIKLLKKLEQECKIKSVKSINSNKKMYILYDVEPDKTVTGGVWFTNNDIDLELVNNLSNVLYKYIKNRQNKENKLPNIENLATIVDCHNFLVDSKVLEVEISLSETKMIIRTLQFDCKIDCMKKACIEYFYALNNIDEEKDD